MRVRLALLAVGAEVAEDPEALRRPVGMALLHQPQRAHGVFARGAADLTEVAPQVDLLRIEAAPVRRRVIARDHQRGQIEKEELVLEDEDVGNRIAPRDRRGVALRIDEHPAFVAEEQRRLASGGDAAEDTPAHAQWLVVGHI